MRIFILEDEIGHYPRNQILSALAKHELTVATSCPDAKKKYDGPYDLLLLDHDMEGNYEYRPDYPNTGHQFVKWLVEQDPVPKPEVVLHSQNPVGRTNMRQLLEEHGFSVTEFPFGPEYVKGLKRV
jgi:CheY-like chemotaxis protein